MIIHAATVELHPNDLRALRESGLPLGPAGTPDRLVPVARADLASRLNDARASTDDPARLAVIVSYLKQLRA
jgi:hypothetical protein